jgi:hypothetical protein
MHVLVLDESPADPDLPPGPVDDRDALDARRGVAHDRIEPGNRAKRSSPQL